METSKTAADFFSAFGAGLAGLPPGAGMNFAMPPRGIPPTFYPRGQPQFRGFSSAAKGDWHMLLNGLAQMGRPQLPLGIGGAPVLGMGTYSPRQNCVRQR